MVLINLLRRRRCLRTLIILTIAIPLLYNIGSLVSHRYSKNSVLDTIHLEDISNTSEVKQECVHPKLQIWHPELKQHFVTLPPVICRDRDGGDDNWVYSANGTFYISKDMSEKHHGRIDCKMTPIFRGKDDYEVERGKTVKPFKNASALQSDIFEAKCVAADGQTRSTVLLGVAPSPEAKKRAKIPLPKSSLGLDILMFGFDSVSRLSWIRNLPKTLDYFTKDLGGVVLEGYNIVGDGTPQALLPLLTGKNESELPEARRGWKDATQLDGHPWIWNDLKKLGYATQWGEDSASFGTFHYRMLGFKEQPVDHFMRSFYIEAEKHYSKYRRFCLGSMLISKNMMNYLRDFCDVYSTQRKFSFLFHAEYTHAGYSELQHADDDLVELLQYLKSRGHLDNAMLILMADHGARFNTLRSTEQGKYEERLPFFSVRFPEKFLAAHPDIARNLKINGGRLTTAFDIHATFKDIVDFKNDQPKLSEDPSEPLPRGISLFREIPKRRSCQDAGIEPHWCACLAWEAIPLDDKLAASAASAIVDKINTITAPEREVCQELEVHKILEARRYGSNDNLLKFKKSDFHGRTPQFSDNMTRAEELYQILLIAKPSGGKYEATAKRNTKSGLITVDALAISRTNKYGKQPHCVAEKFPHMRAYCYCKKQFDAGAPADVKVVKPDASHDVATEKPEINSVSKVPTVYSTPKTKI